MSRARVAVVALVLAVATCQAAAPWERKAEFAKELAARSYPDFGEPLLDALATDRGIPASERPALYLALAECWADLASAPAARGTPGGWQERAIHCLGKARALFAQYLEHPAVKNDPAAAQRRFEAALRSAWLLTRIAAAHGKLSEQRQLPAPQKQRHMQEATRGYEAAAGELDAIVAQKQPTRPWPQEDRRLATDHVKARLARNQARIDLAAFLKGAGAPEAQWKPSADAAAKDYKRTLLDFYFERKMVQVNVPYGEALLLLGEHQAALERLEEVWRLRLEFTDHKAIPCKARYLAASALLRQGKPKEALDAIGEMLVARTAGAAAYDPKAISAEGVKGVLEELDEGDIAAQFDRRQVADALLLAAEAFAALGDKARADKRPEQEARDLFAKACHIVSGVCEAEVPFDPKHVPLIARWCREADLPLLPALLRRLGERAALDGRYHDAARDLTAALAGDKPKPEELRKSWEQVAACHYKAGDCYSAATVFRALSRWFPRPAAKALDYASWAYGAMKQQAEQTGEPADQAIADEFGREAERLGPQGPGPLCLRLAIEERKAGRPQRSLALLAEIGPRSPAYPGALCEAVLAHKAMFEGLPEAEQTGSKGRDTLHAMCLAAYKLLEHAKSGPATDRRHLADNLALAHASACETLLKENVREAAKALGLAADVQRACPGISDSPAFPRLLHARLRAASLLLPTRSDEECRRLAASIEADWKALTAFPDFASLPNACRLTADALDHLATRSGDAARAAAARDRGLECWLKLLSLAPRQPIATYRFALAALLKRPHEPKSADCRQIASIAPKAIELHSGLRGSFAPLSRLDVPLGEAYRRHPEHRPAIDLLLVESTLAEAHCRLGNWRSAIPLLAEFQQVAEAIHQNRVAAFARDAKRMLPARDSLHVEARRWLARCYLETNARENYATAQAFLFDDLALHTKDEPDYWETLYWLSEALRRSGSHEEALKLIRKSLLAAHGIPDALLNDRKGTRDDFRRLVAQIQQDAAKLDGAARRNSVLDSAAEALRQLGK